MQSVSRATAAATLEQSQRAVAQKVVDRVFDSMRRLNVQSGIVQDYSTPDEWRHRTTQDVESDLSYLEIHRPEILAALSDYLADCSLRTREIDWLFLNLLTYAEYIATLAEVRKKLLGVDAYIKSLHPPKSEHIPSIAALASRPWQTVIAAGAVALSFVLHPALAIVVGAVFFYWHWQRKIGIANIDSLLTVMLSTYGSFNTVDLSWLHVSRTLEQSRLEGCIAVKARGSEARSGLTHRSTGRASAWLRRAFSFLIGFAT
jgi:hypothetical protein